MSGGVTERSWQILAQWDSLPPLHPAAAPTFIAFVSISPPLSHFYPTDLSHSAR